MLTIKNVSKTDVGYEIGLRPKDLIVEFDNHKVVDILDYMFYDGEESFLMTINRDGEIIDFEVEKDFDETLGLEFENDGLEIISCQNKCVFCFIDQMPKGARNTLYVKDDDYRQSFLCGNYVTLTNVREAELERIIRLHLSPLYVSVHTTNGELRKKLLNNRFADKINDYIKRLDEAGIEMNTQIVLVKGQNDGKELEKTCMDLSKFENVKTLAVVPCGITEHREGLFHIDDITADYAKEVVEQIDGINARLKRNFVYAADEFFLKADLEPKPDEFYGDYSQIENGVGMLRYFETNLDRVAKKKTYHKTFLIVTGVSACNFIVRMSKKVESFCDGLKIYVYACENKYFGSTVTCAGLLTAHDVLESAKNYQYAYDELVISQNMLKEDADVFLDGMTLDELEKELGKPVRVTRGSGDAFFETLTNDN